MYDEHISSYFCVERTDERMKTTHFSWMFQRSSYLRMLNSLCLHIVWIRKCGVCGHQWENSKLVIFWKINVWVDNFFNQPDLLEVILERFFVFGTCVESVEIGYLPCNYRVDDVIVQLGEIEDQREHDVEWNLFGGIHCWYNFFSFFDDFCVLFFF